MEAGVEQPRRWSDEEAGIGYVTIFERYREEDGYPVMLYVFFLSMLLGGFLLLFKDYVFGFLVLLLGIALSAYLIFQYAKEVEQEEPWNKPFKIFSGWDFYGGMALIAVSLVIFLSNSWPWFQMSTEASQIALCLGLLLDVVGIYALLDGIGRYEGRDRAKDC